MQKLLVPPASLEARVNDYLARKVCQEPDEQDTDFALRRHADWSEMVKSPAYGDLTDMVRRARDGVTRDLVLGTRDKHGDDNAEAKRAMIYTFNTILHFYDDVERRATEARSTIRRFVERGR